MKRLTEEQQSEFMAAKHVAGAIIGEITITDCVKECDSIWFFGPYAFMQKDAELYKTPVPCRGQLGFFYPPRNVIEQIEKMKTSHA